MYMRYVQTPPLGSRSLTDDRMSMHASLSDRARLVHDDATELVEPLRIRHGLREEVSWVLISRHIRYLELKLLDHIAHIEVSLLVVVLMVVRNVMSVES